MAYTAFGREQDFAHAQMYFEKVLLHLKQSSWPTQSIEFIEQLAAAAQLYSWFTASKVSLPLAGELLAALDTQLLAKAYALLAGSHADQKSIFFRLLRYFQLRLPNAMIAEELHALFHQARKTSAATGQGSLLLPAAHELASDSGPIYLGLADGLAGEALQLIRLYQAGIQEEAIEAAIKARIMIILATRREVDFSEGIYGMFPDVVASGAEEIQSSQELTWRSGDIGQALLLYEAHALFKDEELANLAELVGLNTLLRKDARATRVSTSAFCTGAAGTAHLYGQLYYASGNPAYHEGYRYWLTQTQQYVRQDMASNYYQAPRGLRHSLVSVGLVLLTAISECELKWEQSIL
ncbi:lanthionine synthetase LanC family protein [Hymenobacter cavernae]|uniref:Uncharacterized protein n=1 Tax=Hymenobacter cavernae TaxID=2044852 RepID=A0ABQ1TW57_9BACT|nr:lanthionine synthetase LanC family protein [Hymenobacter cavernae]GGF03965.1 hypothetical protein GCM10011383_13790 [Hymenobacter cavernae]